MGLMDSNLGRIIIMILVVMLIIFVFMGMFPDIMDEIMGLNVPDDIDGTAWQNDFRNSRKLARLEFNSLYNSLSNIAEAKAVNGGDVCVGVFDTVPEKFFTDNYKISIFKDGNEMALLLSQRRLSEVNSKLKDVYEEEKLSERLIVKNHAPCLIFNNKDLFDSGFGNQNVKKLDLDEFYWEEPIKINVTNSINSNSLNFNPINDKKYLVYKNGNSMCLVLESYDLGCYQSSASLERCRIDNDNATATLLEYLNDNSLKGFVCQGYEAEIADLHNNYQRN